MNQDPQNIQKVSSELKRTDETRCDYCQRQMTSEAEWIRGEKQVICETCYRNFLNPGRNCCEREMA